MRVKTGIKMTYKSQEGAILVWAVIFLMVFSILGVSMLTLSSHNLKETVYQREHLKAYYLAESGIDLAYTALMHKEGDSPLIDTYIADSNKTYNQTIAMGADTITLTIESVLIDGKFWVKVTSTGTVSKSGYSQTTYMRINIGQDNFRHIIREDD